LTWEQIAAMSATGMDMELHSREHYDLRNRPNDFLVHQIAGGKESLEAHINRPVRWLAYPSGRYDAAVVRVLKSDGFWGALTTKQGRTYVASGFFDLQRIRIDGSYTLDTFIKVITESP
jgi:peptidoglycan/xylan/chitin deacetylase (PgdA/CDA1 family)